MSDTPQSNGYTTVAECGKTEGCHAGDPESKLYCDVIGQLLNDSICLLIRNNVTEAGRNSSNSAVDFHIGDSKFVSRKHIIIEYCGEDSFKLHIIGKNGIFMDNLLYRKRDQPYILPKQCTFRIPSTTITFQFESSVDERNAMVDLNKYTPVHADGNEVQKTTMQNQGFGETMKLQKLASPELKPPYTYAQMIVQAISVSPSNNASLAEIYSFISERYPYYRHQPGNGWQRSIRHNLSVHSHFINIPRPTYHQGKGKGGFWTVAPSRKQELFDRCFKCRGHRHIPPQSNATVDLMTNQPIYYANGHNSHQETTLEEKQAKDQGAAV